MEDREDRIEPSISLRDEKAVWRVIDVVVGEIRGIEGVSAVSSVGEDVNTYRIRLMPAFDVTGRGTCYEGDGLVEAIRRIRDAPLKVSGAESHEGEIVFTVSVDLDAIREARDKGYRALQRYWREHTGGGE